MKHDRGTFTLNKDELIALTTFACADETRAHINCVQLIPSSGSVAATDGHTLLCLTATDTGCKGDTLMVPREMMMNAKAMLRRKQQVLKARLAGRGKRKQLILEVFETNDTRAPLATLSAPCDARLRPTPIDRTLSSIPVDDTRTTSVIYGVNPEYAARLGLIGKLGCVGLRHLGTDDVLGPIYYIGHYIGVDVTVVLMPMRI